MIHLKFYDHHRQHYHDVVPIREDRAIAEFMIGDYGDGKEGVGPGGEFSIYFIEKIGPEIHCFGDALGSLMTFLADEKGREFMEVGSRGHHEASLDLIAMGIGDVSDTPLGKNCDQ